MEYCNKIALKMFGYKDAEHFEIDYFHRLALGTLNTKLQECFKGPYGKDEPIEFDHTFTANDNRKVVGRFKIVPMTDDNGSYKLICYIEDISEYIPRVENQDEEFKFIKILENENDGIVIVQDQLVKYFNGEPISKLHSHLFPTQQETCNI
nr:PAS domain-containing protein [uncultured Methanomethylovorans sp.]